MESESIAVYDPTILLFFLTLSVLMSIKVNTRL